jgi:hypothetical protein
VASRGVIHATGVKGGSSRGVLNVVESRSSARCPPDPEVYAVLANWKPVL